MAVTALSGQRWQGLSYGGSAISQDADSSDDNYLGQDTGSGNILRLGFNPQSDNALIGRTVTQITFPLKKRGSPTGNVRVVEYDSDFSTVLTTGTSNLDSSTITGSFVNYTFDIAVTFTSGRYYAIETNGTNNWSDTNGIEPRFSSSETVTGNISAWYANAKNQTDNTMSISISASGDVKPTDVPVGSQFEETDTRKFYQFKEGGGIQVENVFGSDYTWATAGDSGCSITTGNDPSGYGTSAGTLSSYRRAKTTITSGNTKTFVWKFTWSRNSGDSANNSILTLANFDWADSTPSGDQKNIKFQTSNGNVAFWRAQTATASVTSTQDGTFLQAAGTTRYYTVTGDGTNWKAQSWSDSDRTTDEETTGDLGFPADWTSTDAIDNLTFGSFGTASSDFTVKEVSVKWDSGITADWIERGTAL
jgi:hypothetical protein